MDGIEISFPHSSYPGVTVGPHQPLAECLTVVNSPVLFGCRTGICGTCLVWVQGEVSPPGPEEQELLDILAPNCPQARLACQLDPIGPLQISPLEMNHGI